MAEIFVLIVGVMSFLVVIMMSIGRGNITRNDVCSWIVGSIYRCWCVSKMYTKPNGVMDAPTEC